MVLHYALRYRVNGFEKRKTKWIAVMVVAMVFGILLLPANLYRSPR